MAIGMHSKSRILDIEGRHEEAIGEYQRCILVLHGIVDESPELHLVRESLINCLRDLTPLLRNAGRYCEATQAAMERRALLAGQAGRLYNIALDLAQNAAAMAEWKQGAASDAPMDAASTNSASDQEIRDVADMALDVLQEAIDAGWKDFARLRTEKPFKAVWRHASQRELPSELDTLRRQSQELLAP
jgi:hypothetical protein